MINRRFHPYLVAAIAVWFAVIAVPVSANHDLVLDFDVANSWFGVDLSGNGIIDGTDPVVFLDEGPDGGIKIAQGPQPASGSHTGVPDGSESPGIDQPWELIANTGMHLTNIEVTFSGSHAQLDFSGWAAIWNGYPSSDLSGDTATYPSETGIASLSCSGGTCEAGDTYTLDYQSHLLPADPSGLGGLLYVLHLEGNVNGTTGSNPAITLTGANPVTHASNTPFTDPGATASDAEDGDLTGSIVVSGSVNDAVPGLYTLQYDVTDSDGHTDTVTRDVLVAPLLAFDAGVYSCIGDLGTPPDACSIGTEVVSGSWFGVDDEGDGIVTPDERVPLLVGPDGGLQPGIAQTASGSHAGPPDNSEMPGLDAPWLFFGHTGMHYAITSIDFITPTTLDFSGWSLTWNTLPYIELGGDPVNFPGTDTQIADISCDNTPCLANDFFSLDYYAHIPLDDPYGFAGVAYELHLEGIATPGAVPLNCGDVLSGSIDISTETDLFTFSGNSGDVIDLIITETTDWGGFSGANDAQVTVYSPTGVQVDTFDSVNQRQITLLETGTYQIQVASNNGVGMGSYNLGMACILPPAPPPTALACGDVLSGSIDVSAETDLFTFSGSSGDVIDLTITETTDWGGSFGANDAQVTVYSPTGLQVDTFDSDNQRQITLPEAGSYVVRITANNYQATGSYNLAMACILPPAPPPTVLVCGDVLSGSIDVSAETDLFTFNGSSGDVIDLIITETTDWGGSFGANDAQVTVYSPTGLQVDTFDSDNQRQITLPEAGSYVVRITANNYQATGSYNLGMACILPPAPPPTVLVCGDVLSGSIDVSAETDLFTFNGSSGDVIDLTITETTSWGGGSGANDAQVTVYSPSGVQVDTFDSDNQRQITLPEAGSYVVRITANNYQATGSYNLGMACILPPAPPPTVLACGDVLSGSIDVSAETDLFTYSGSSGEVVSLTITETTDWGGGSGANDAQVTVYSPTGVQVMQFDSSQTQNAVLAETGVHVIRVNANNNQSTGPYDLGLDCVERAPVLDLDGSGGTTYSTTFTEDGGGVLIGDPGLGITDPDSALLASLTISIGANATADDVLSYPGGIGSITVDPSSTATNLILLGPDSATNFTAALLAVRYNNTSDDPDLNPRTLTITIQDNTGQQTIGTTTITLTAVNDRPVIDLDGGTLGTTGNLALFTEGDPAVQIGEPGNVVIDDPDSTTLSGARIALTNAGDGDMLSIGTFTPGNISVLTQTNNLIVLESDPPAPRNDYQTFFDLIHFEATSEDPGNTSRTVDVTVTDAGGETSLVSTATIQVTPVNDQPELSLDADGSSAAPAGDYETTFLAGAGGSAVRVTDADTLITDFDDPEMSSATVTLTNPVTEDVLAITGTLPSGITQTGSGSHSIALTGDADIAAYITALESITLDNPQPVVSAVSRIIHVDVNDGDDSSDTRTTTVLVEHAPVIDLDADDSSGATGDNFQTVFLTGTGLPVRIADVNTGTGVHDISVTEGDGEDLSQVIIKISNPDVDDELSVNGVLPPGISPGVNSTSHRLILTGADTTENYATAISLVEFSNVNPIPDPLLRTLTVRATDLTGNTGRAAVSSIAVDSNFAVSFSPVSPVVPADTDLTYTITVTNVGDQTATDVVLTDTIPEDGFVMDISSTDWDCNEFDAGTNPVVICTLASLASGQTVTASITVLTPTETGEFINTVVVTNSDPATFGTGGGMQETMVVEFPPQDDRENPTFGFRSESKIYDQVPLTGASFGSVLVYHGDTLIIGSPDDMATSNNSGTVSIYTHDESGWNFLQQLEKQGTQLAGDDFGAAIAFNGTWLVIGAPGAGEAWIYDFATLTPQPLTATGVTNTDEYGYAVAIEGDTAVVGSPAYPGAGISGRAYVFDRNGSSWAEGQVLEADPVQDVTVGGGQTRFGHALALADGTLAVGAPFDGTAPSQGAVLVYEKADSLWINPRALLKPTVDLQDMFGRALAMDGDTIVVGARYHSTSLPDAGAAHVFVRNNDTWSQQQKLTAHDAGIQDEFASSLAIEVDTVIVGAPMAESGAAAGAAAGAAYVFTRTGNTWQEQQKPTAPDGAVNDAFGSAVALLDTRALIGSPVNDHPTATNAGSVYSVSVANNNEIKLVAADATAGAELGAATALSGATLVAGAPGHEHSGLDQAGAAYVYRRNGSSWPLVQQLLASDAGESDRFGASVDADGAFVIVGAPFNKNVAVEGGMAYIYRDTGSGWTETRLGNGTLVPDAQLAPFDLFGTAVAIEGQNAVVAAPGDGELHLYGFDGFAWSYTDSYSDATGTVERLGSYIDIEGSTVVAAATTVASGNGHILIFDYAGESFTTEFSQGFTTAVTSLQLSGDRLLVGLSGEDRVEQFIRTDGIWSPDSFMDAGSDPFFVDFGQSVALHGELALISDGAYARIAPNAGAAYLFNGLIPGGATGTWEPYRITASDAQDDDEYGGTGGAVAVNLDAHAVGAHLEDSLGFGSDSGSVYLYPTGVSASTYGGNFNGPERVTLSCTNCAEIYYTLDSSAPTLYSGAGTGPFVVSTTTTVGVYVTDADGRQSETQILVVVVDEQSPDVTVDPLVNNAVTVSPLTQPLLTGTASDPVGGTGLQIIQVEIRDAETLDYIQNTEDLSPSKGQGQVWLTATGTDVWSLPFTGSNHPFEEGHTYNVRVRAFDKVGNVSPIETLSFGYLTSAPKFMTLELTLTKSSIVQNDVLDADIKLTNPADINEDLSTSTVDLEILAPDDTLTVLQDLPTDVNGLAQIQNLGDGSDITFNQAGPYYMHARFNQNGTDDFTREPADSDFRTLLVGQSAGYAVIVQGSLSGASPEGFDSHSKTASRVYQTLIERQLQPDDIEYFSFDTDQDFDLDALDGTVFSGGVDAIPSRSAIQTAIQDMYLRINSNPAPFYLIMVDHGDKAVVSPPSEAKFHINTEIIVPSDIDTWLDSLESNLSDLTQPRVSILGMCYSGAFINAISAPNRVVITSAAETEVSYKGAEEPDNIRVGEYYLEELFRRLGRGQSFREAFENATAVTEVYTRRNDSGNAVAPYFDTAVQHPQVDDNGDGTGSNDLNLGADGALIETMFLGVGPDFDANALDVPGDIVDVTDTVSLPAGTGLAETSAFLTLTANDNAKVSSAWVEVRAPGITYQETGTATEQVQIEPNLDRRALIKTPTDWIYEYQDFTNIGRYEVFYFVKDTLTGAVSAAQRSVVYKNYIGNPAPDPFNLLLPVDGATTATVLLFDWESSNDSDGLTYTLQIAEVDDPVGNPGVCSFNTIEHTQEELAVSHAYVGPSVGLQDATDYCWRVFAIDSFGETTVSTPGSRTFSTDNDNGYLGYVSGTVRDAVSLVGLDGAVVTPSDGTVVDYTEDSGSYLIAVDPAGTYTFTASVTGYANADRSAAATVQVNTGEDILLTSDTLDTDGDGTPDNVDTDDDNDGISDVDEIAEGSDPLDDMSWPRYADGDLNADGNVNAGDYLIAMRISLGLVTATPVHLAHGDMAPTTPDGVIDTPDVLLVLRAVMGL